MDEKDFLTPNKLEEVVEVEEWEDSA